MTPAPSLLLGQRYAIVRELGRGGAATVYLATDTQLERPVAAKVLRQELAAALGRDRFLREIRFASLLRHPHIVPVLDFGETDDQLWYVMPFIAGGTLRERLDREAQLRIDDTVRWGAEIADALSYAHAQEIVHRDVKPENILLDGEHAWLADFGVARALGELPANALTSAGVAIGTPAYMSPEQGSGSGDLDGRSDVYSLACVLYECLAGVPPFVGRTAQSLIAQRFAHAPHPVSSYRSTTPPGVQDAIEGGLRVVPADRLDAHEMFELLRRESTAELRLPSRRDVVSVGAATPESRFTRGAVLAAVGAVALVVAATILVRGSEQAPLDANKVVIFPLEASGAAAQVTAGVPSLIGSALDGVPPLRWVEGDALVGRDPEDGTRDHAAHVRLTRGVDAAHFIDGTLFVGSDSITVVLRLVDAARDSVVARSTASAAGDARSAPSLALRATGQLLPQLLEPGRRVDLRALTQRAPAAIAEYMLGEREFRRSRYESALAHYQRALAADSSLAVAALKAARSARSLFREADARRFVALALARDSLLPGANAPFARGLSHFYRHRGDSALLYLRQAAVLAPEWAEVQAALGDVHFYLGIDSLHADSAAESHFRRARAQDSTFTPALYHLAWLAARRRDPVATRAFVREHESAESPDTTFVRAAMLAAECQDKGIAGVDWATASRTTATALVMLGKVLAASGADVPCSRAALTAVFSREGPPTSDHFGAMVGLNALAMLTADTASLRLLGSSAMGAALRVRNLLVFDALADSTVLGAERAVRDMQGELPALAAEELWLLGAWLSERRRARELEATIAQLRQLEVARPSARVTRMRASLESRAQLLAGDTASAVQQLARVHEAATFQDTEWRIFESRAADHALLARLTLATGQQGAGMRTAQRLQHPHAIMNVVFLRAATQWRAETATRQQNAPLAAALTSRLTRWSAMHAGAQASDGTASGRE